MTEVDDVSRNAGDEVLTTARRDGAAGSPQQDFLQESHSSGRGGGRRNALKVRLYKVPKLGGVGALEVGEGSGGVARRRVRGREGDKDRKMVRREGGVARPRGGDS